MDTNNILEVSSQNKAAVHVKSFAIGSTQVAEKEIDLTDWQGKVFRLYVEKDGTISTDQEHGHFWLLAEAAIPDAVISNKMDGQGNATQVVQALDLTNVKFMIFTLPTSDEVEGK